MRAKHGESTTAFEAIYDGTQAFSKGDIVRINAKPQYIGRVVHFTVPQVRARVPEHSAAQDSRGSQQPGAGPRRPVLTAWLADWHAAPRPHPPTHLPRW